MCVNELRQCVCSVLCWSQQGWSLSSLKNHLAVSDRLGVRGRHLSAELMFFGGVIKDGFDPHFFAPRCSAPWMASHSFNGERAAYEISSLLYCQRLIPRPWVKYGVVGQCCIKSSEGSGGSNKGCDNTCSITASLSCLSELYWGRW